jgi:hypothetical protein
VSVERPTKRWEPGDVDRMLAALPVVEAEGFVAATWSEPQVEIVDGVRHTSMPYPVYHPVVQTLWELCSGTGASIDPYAVLPEDPEGTEPGTGVLKVLESRERFAAATLDQIRRYFVLCTRGERFCDGFIAGEFAEGRMLAALRRLRELRDAMAPEEPA